MNKTEFKAEMIRHNENVESLSALINVSPATFYKKQNENSFTVAEVKAISEKMELSSSQVNNIFFNWKLAFANIQRKKNI